MTPLSTTKASRYNQLALDDLKVVVPLRNAAALTTVRIERSASKLVFVGAEWELDMSHWLNHAQIAEAFAFAIDRWSPGRKGNSVFARIGDLDRGFFSFLREMPPKRHLHLLDIDTCVIGNLITWLGKKNANGEPVWSPNTRAGMLTSVRVLLQLLKSSKKWGPRLAANLQVPTHPWLGRNRFGKPREVLDDTTLYQLLLACRNEAMETMSSVKAAWSAMGLLDCCAPHSTNLPTSADEWRWLHAKRYKERIPNSNWVKENDPQLWFGYRRSGLTYITLRRPLTPSPRDFVPFVFLLAFLTSFNPDVMRGLTLDDIDYPDHFGGQRIRFRPLKERSGRKQVRSFAMGDPVGPDALVSFITDWTSWLRVIASPERQRMLFLVVTRGPSDAKRTNAHATDFNGGGHKAGAAWYASLTGFLADHGLPQLSLAQIRPTSLDQVHEMTGGDLKAVQLAGGQRSPQVILDHYTSDAARKRNDEALAVIMHFRERFVGSKGATADPRKEPGTADKGCATPGFMCLDPFASPMAGEHEGRLCQSYGMCPSCPLACVNSKDPYVAARVIQLRKAVVDAQEKMAPRRWIEAWAPVANRLDDYWLPLFDDEIVLAEAAKLTLPHLPALE